jgi:two-component system phosphate regulon sensor histidine kinase PhoR
VATLRAAWDAVADALAVSDSHGVVIAVNAAYCRLYGFAEQQLVGQSFAVIFPEQVRPAAEEQYRAVFERGEFSAHESRVRRADGTELIVEARASFIEHDGQRVGMLSTIRDITAQRTAEAERDALIESASHDLRQPLSRIKIRAELLQRMLHDELSMEQLNTGLRQITAAVDDVTQQLSSLRDAVELQAGQPVVLKYQAVELTRWLTDLVGHHQAGTDRHTLVCETPRHRLVACIDEVRLRRVVGNLLSNAVKYSPNGGKIHVRLSWADELDDGQMLLEVEDQGIGIRSADLPRVFLPYFRTSEAASLEPGTGLGLAGSLAIVQQHGGSLTVDSEPDRGSVFRVRLPLRPPS